MSVYLSVCSGIEAATVAWEPLGWRPWAFAEVDTFPSAVLAHHYPNVPNLGDMTQFQEWPDATIDVLVGGTPCQSFSVAGLRAGLDDPRGGLLLTYLAIALRYRPRWVVWENVPGVLSSDGGRAFGSLLGGLAELGYGFAYRILDAQHFGLAQRRQRVFVVGHLGDWRRAAAVLFERASLSGHPAPRREAGQRVADGAGVSAAVSSGRGWWDTSEVGATIRAQDSVTKADTLIASTGPVSHCLNAGGMGRIDYESETLIAHTLRGEGFDAGEDGTGRGTPLVAEPYTLAIRGRGDSHNLEYRQEVPAMQSGQPASVAASTANALLTPNGGRGGIGVGGMAVRRLTPRECERLQGFPDDYTLIPYRKGLAADGPRYKALGNSMAVPVMRWIGQRMATIDREDA